MPARVDRHALARERAEAAADLETAIVSLGLAYEGYQRTTQQLADLVHADLARRLEVPIVLHLARAGLSSLLERKLHAGTPASLRTLVDEQHEQLGL